MADHEGELFRHIDGEKSLNDFFSSLLARSNTSRVLNAVHREIRFRNDAEVVATQRDGLDEHPDENSKLRTLDWVVKDGGKMVGYESKTGNPLDATQLQEERRKLNENADGREAPSTQLPRTYAGPNSRPSSIG